MAGEAPDLQDELKAEGGGDSSEKPPDYEGIRKGEDCRGVSGCQEMIAGGEEEACF